MPTQFYGIRHHGAGSTRHLLNALNAQQPDLILLEAPPEAQSLLPLAAHADMKPPVALLAYRPDAPQNAIYYPFAEYSPEWQTLQFAAKNHIEVRFFDLPLQHSLADEFSGCLKNENDEHQENSDENSQENLIETNLYQDPFDHLAQIVGLPDGEVFWEQFVEQRQDGQDIFAAIQAAVSALREHETTSPNNALREAHMRKMLRQAEKDAQNIAVVCGAWHVPALTAKVAAKDDTALLKNLPKCKVACTFIPWTNNRLTFASGYGAGIHAPAWYAHLWHYPDDDGVLWVGRAAAALREKGFDVSAAHVIETVRLANATAALRGQSRPNLADFVDAIGAIIGMGETLIIDLIKNQWLIGSDIGSVPDDTPQLPLLADVAAQRKKCRLPETAEHKTLELDLRKPLDLQRSILINRMILLDIHWAEHVHSNSTGTFKETWRMAYQPEHHIQLTERAVHGNTLEKAVANYVRQKVADFKQLRELANLLRLCLPADVPELLNEIATQIANASADSHDLADNLHALPELVDIVRYGSVRDFDAAPLQGVLATLLARLAAGGVQGCLNIDTDTAQSLFTRIRAADYAMGLLNDEDLTALWQTFLKKQMAAENAHALLSGNAARILFDKQGISEETMSQIFSLSLSTAQSYEHAAHWLEGFLYQSGTILLINNDLWQMIDDWLRGLSDEVFTELLPLLRRTFSSFEFGERRQLGEKAAQNGTETVSGSLKMPTQNQGAFNETLREKAAETVRMLLQAA
ncbi:DUF5682 family protein [Alysiella crassa]|uniref:Uncharacterized protein n=1 Tax=Alysiella crassa TaxID=153491 RepID=A0A376BMS8_9NEIS|nr:DUF5682 family protein [Alysiella crassa]UOP06913.1 DUF5682 family protein [Alysiella crassa]SSY70958.1 Uncharacterised protein [Alysiella crassa]